MRLLPSPRLDTWTRLHAIAMLVAFGGALAAGRAWPVALTGIVSLTVFCRYFAPRERPFGFANGVTAVRVALVGLIGSALDATRGLRALVAVVAYALDGLDGWYARRTGTASRFGSRFDMEADAFFVLVVELELWQQGHFGVWIMSTGLLRYAYVLVTALVPPRRGELERSRYGRLAYGSLAIGLIAALIAPNALGGSLAALGTLLVAASFVRSFVHAYASLPPGQTAILQRHRSR